MNRSVVLRWLLVAALLWLPVADLTAAAISAEASFGVALKEVGPLAASPGYEMDHSAMHHSQSTGSADQKSLSSMEPIHVVVYDCVDHQTTCCTACMSFCATAMFLSLPVNFPGIERCHSFSDALMVVVLPRDIRPPIA